MSIFNNTKMVLEKIENAVVRCGSKEHVRLVAATKTVIPSDILESVRAGVQIIGENRVQEITEKFDDLKNAVSNIHLIGHLQTNKIKYIVDKVTLIHSVDSIKLIKELNEKYRAHHKTIDILLEVNVAKEAGKYGFFEDEVEAALGFISTNTTHVQLKGLMTIPPFSPDAKESAKYFSKLYKLFIDFKGKKMDNIDMLILSMGMSSDFEVAIEAGSNMVRVGSAIFGQRV